MSDTIQEAIETAKRAYVEATGHSPYKPKVEMYDAALAELDALVVEHDKYRDALREIAERAEAQPLLSGTLRLYGISELARAALRDDSRLRAVPRVRLSR